MKISKITIKDYNQFKDFTIDLTYPQGHTKAGRPLEKVCFIGQSGTGKSTVLNLIRTIISYEIIDANYANDSMIDISAETHFSDNINRHIRINKGEISAIIDKKHNVRTTKVKNIKGFLSNYYGDSNVLISFPAEINTDFNQILREEEKGDSHIFYNPKNEKIANNRKNANSLKFKFFDFEFNNVKDIWDNILKDIQQFKVSQLSFMQDLTNKMRNQMIDPDKFREDFNKWNIENKNPLKPLAEKLNVILNKFNLEIKAEPDFKSADDLKFIKIHQKSGGEIPNNYWSTGTKQLILTATPLLKLNTDKSIILIDEPERSFYPDIQQEIINFYTELAPKAQFFIATHSPIIASSFEPWEIVEFKFDDDGKLFQDLYYKNERHVDNYFIQPQYLRWDSILSKIFDLEQDGNPTRKEKLLELSEIGLKLNQLKEQDTPNPDEVKKKWKEYKELAELLDWKIETK